MQVNPAGHVRSGSARLAIFWDYDTLWGSRSGGAEFQNTERLLELHEKYDAPACFAVVGAASLPGRRPYHDPAQVRRLHEAGHEVASHSFRHEWLPGLSPSELKNTLRDSKDALEQCIGAPVTTFVPPYNRPFDFAARLAISGSERRKCGRVRTDLPRLLDALSETGYTACRIAYDPFPIQVIERCFRKNFDRPGRLERIRGIWCFRLNTPCGFDTPAIAAVQRHVMKKQLAVAYGHPHSITSDNSQNERFLDRFLAEVAALQRQGQLQIVTPSKLVSGHENVCNLV